jgi:hypothetical protein
MENQLIGAVHVQCFQVRNKDAVVYFNLLLVELFQFIHNLVLKNRDSV